MKIVRLDDVFLHPDHIAKLREYGEVMLYHNVPIEEDIVSRIHDADICITSNRAFISKKILGQASKLKFICVAATGYDAMDMQTISEKGIVVSNVPDYSTEAVAEHTIGLMLIAARLAGKAAQDAKSNTFNAEGYRGKQLKGKVLCVVGSGNIGSRVGEIAEKGFGMSVLPVNSKTERQVFEEMLKKSDFISINAPLTERTKGMIGEKEFSLMKDGVVIVNTGRGAIIDEAAFCKYLSSGKIFAAGLDVVSDEPLNSTCELLSFPNVFITPHIGFNTEEAVHELSKICLSNIEAFIAGNPQNIVS